MSLWNKNNVSSATNEELPLESYTVFPAGMYRGKLEAIDNLETTYGPSLKFRWRIVGGEEDGAEFSALANKRLMPKSKLAKWALAHLSINAFPEGFVLKLSNLIGKEVLITVGVELRQDGAGERNIVRAVDPIGRSTKKTPAAVRPQAQQFSNFEEDDIPDYDEPMRRGESKIEA